MVCIFLKIFLKSSQVFFVLFFILYVFQHIIYVKEMKDVSRIRRRTSFLSVYFFSNVDETAAALQALCPGLWLSLFLWRKKKKKKKKEMARKRSWKKETIFRALIFVIWIVAALNVILVKQDYQK